MMYRCAWKIASMMTSGPRHGQSREQAIANLAAQMHDLSGPIDLLVLPEFVLRRIDQPPAMDAWYAEDPRLEPIRAAVSRLRTWTVLPVLLKDAGWLSNAALLLNRVGRLVGIYRKRHVISPAGESGCEDSVRPGSELPVFSCDGVRLGIQICWDAMYDDGWESLARAGADLIAHPTACTQAVRPAMHALRHRLHIVTACRYGHVDLFDPLGLAAASRSEPGILSAEIPFDTVVVHWTPTLESGMLVRKKFGEKIAFRYSEREASGLFWSIDPRLNIREALQSLGLRDFPDELRYQSAREEYYRRGYPSTAEGMCSVSATFERSTIDRIMVG
jgi:predicted amidohydrolase